MSVDVLSWNLRQRLPCVRTMFPYVRDSPQESLTKMYLDFIKRPEYAAKQPMGERRFRMAKPEWCRRLTASIREFCACRYHTEWEILFKRYNQLRAQLKLTAVTQVEFFETIYCSEFCPCAFGKMVKEVGIVTFPLSLSLNMYIYKYMLSHPASHPFEYRDMRRTGKAST